MADIPLEIGVGLAFTANEAAALARRGAVVNEGVLEIQVIVTDDDEVIFDDSPEVARVPFDREKLKADAVAKAEEVRKDQGNNGQGNG